MIFTDHKDRKDFFCLRFLKRCLFSTLTNFNERTYFVNSPDNLNLTNYSDADHEIYCKFIYNKEHRIGKNMNRRAKLYQYIRKEYLKINDSD